jgi:hypothetical protein
MSKYAVKVMLSKDDWIYVTEPDGTMFEVRPILFNTRELAEEHARIWGNEDVARVVRWRKK